MGRERYVHCAVYIRFVASEFWIWQYLTRFSDTEIPPRTDGPYKLLLCIVFTWPWWSCVLPACPSCMHSSVHCICFRVLIIPIGWNHHGLRLSFLRGSIRKYPWKPTTDRYRIIILIKKPLRSWQPWLCRWVLAPFCLLKFSHWHLYDLLHRCDSNWQDIYIYIWGDWQTSA